MRQKEEYEQIRLRARAKYAEWGRTEAAHQIQLAALHFLAGLLLSQSLDLEHLALRYKTLFYAMALRKAPVHKAPLLHLTNYNIESAHV